MTRLAATLISGIVLAGCASAAPSAAPATSPPDPGGAPSATTPQPQTEPVTSPLLVSRAVPSASPVVIPDRSPIPAASVTPEASAGQPSPSAEAIITVLSDPHDTAAVRAFLAGTLEAIRSSYIDGDTDRLKTYFYDSSLEAILMAETN